MGILFLVAILLAWPTFGLSIVAWIALVLFLRIRRVWIQVGRVEHFRTLKNVFGQPEIPGIDMLSDQRILAICGEVEGAFAAIANRKGERLPGSVIDGLIRDLLEAEVNGDYTEQFEQMKEMYSSYDIRMILTKGRAY